MIDNRETEIEREARAGDAHAFGQFLRAHDRDFRNVVWSVFRSSTHIDDVMQSSYERAFAKIGTFDGRSSLKTWVSTICYRTAIDHARFEGRRRHQSVDDQHAPVRYDQTLDGGVDVASLISDRDQLERAMASLNPEEAAILTMTAGLGYSFDDVAEVMNIKRGTVASRASRARRRLQEELQS